MSRILSILESDASSNGRLNIQTSSSRPKTNVVAGLRNVPTVSTLWILGPQLVVLSGKSSSCALATEGMSLGMGFEIKSWPYFQFVLSILCIKNVSSQHPPATGLLLLSHFPSMMDSYIYKIVSSNSSFHNVTGHSILSHQQENYTSSLYKLHYIGLRMPQLSTERGGV